MVLVIPICAVLAFAQVLYLAMNPVDPFTAGASSFAAVAAVGVSASALVVHAAHSILGHWRLPSYDEHRKFDNLTNTYPYRSIPCLSPKPSNTTTLTHETTSSASPLGSTTQSYLVPRATSLVGLWAPTQIGIRSDLSPRNYPSPSPASHPLYKDNWGSCLLQRPILNATALSEYCPIRVSAEEPRPELAPRSPNLENGTTATWSIGCLGFVIGLICGISIGTSMAQGQTSSAKQGYSVLSPTPLPAAWTIHTIDGSAAPTTVKQYSSVLSTIVEAIDNPGCKDLWAETDSVTITPQDPVTVMVTVSDYNLDSTTLPNGLSAVDPASVPLPEDEPEELSCEAENHGTVDLLVAALVPLPQDDLETQTLDSDMEPAGNTLTTSNQTGPGCVRHRFDSIMGFNSTMSLCSVIDGLSFNVTSEGLVGRREWGADTADDTQCDEHPKTSKESEIEEVVDGVPSNPAERQQPRSEEEHKDLESEPTLSTASGTQGIDPVDDDGATSLGTNENDSGSSALSDDNSEPQGSRLDVDHPQYDAPILDQVAEDSDCQQVHPVPAWSPSSPALYPVATSMHARHSRLEETVEAESGETAPTWTDSSMLDLSSSSADSNGIWLLSEDQSMDSRLGLVNVDSLLEIMERESGRDEWLLGITIDELSSDWTFSQDGVPGIASSPT